jgi:hypothetical protein
MPRHSTVFVPVVILASAIACTDVTRETAETVPSSAITCVSGCTETDPYPDSAGVFLTSAVTDDTCNNTISYTDTDRDGLIDRCERDIAAAFAPQLYYYEFDEVGREPHWVARKVSLGKVMIGYLLSYYRDAGSTAFACSIPGAPSSCHGHNGDSEAIFLQVYYNERTKHWILDEARYSQHGELVLFTRGAQPFPLQLLYPGGAGRYPRAYVSQGKHANYESKTACNNGGTLDIDTCTSVNTGARVVAGGQLNLSSRSVHTSLQDCMESANPSYVYYGSGRKECYWTNQNFRGWIPTTVGGAESDPYSPVLSVMGF